MPQIKSTYSRKRRSEVVPEPSKCLKSTTTSRSHKTSSTTLTKNKVSTTRLNVYVFGEGSAGELGLGPKNATDVTSPRLNSLLDADEVGVVDIAAGGMHAVALTYDGHVLTWGVNDNDALGRETAWDGGVKDITEGDDASDDDSEDGELNPYESTPTAIPTEIFGKSARIVQVTAGDSASFALTEKGFVYGWGTFVSNEAKNGFYWNQRQNQVIEKQNKPMLIPKLEKIVQISAGYNFCLALNAAGKVYSWGMSEQNQLGRRLVLGRQYSTSVKQDDLDKLYLRAGLIPGLVPFSSKTKIVSVHAGSDHAFAIDQHGDTWAWGLNNFGQTGIKVGAGANGTTVIAPQKVQSLAGKNMKIIRGGTHHSIGVNQAGECLVWGRMDGAQMGIDLSTIPVDNPQIVVSERGKPRILLEPTALPISSCSFVAAGSDHNILITSEGRAYSWGFNTNYQCGQGADGDDILVATPIDNTAIRGKKLTWAGAGGQYSMLAGPSD
ncbi:hypothetical protein TMatcc_003825 [Talaromyces marneffei ATCC 18224]|uniref:Ran exchange factor Prp20/Pim1, putative n=1 Tax=Talaromyces marneffei (strain ATCC 18224 / CBS 334.59 / QM 7333) TaxID=441960 RepID=B6Q1L2_TALMQ|nr:uncharacterized protein EYB26_001176 [Talaromyces marneffei]EEA27878.1 Ran exchange factor Prp20/Pim1, putative [Talaromyces marneffei ATCC 18224]KAE8556456.1 hypothetical protein EYB25_001157 [Talaromyces marneffei]QGA13526.1 hypothetical protein EYB26_001176 [Talaromyces marneffei]